MRTLFKVLGVLLLILVLVVVGAILYVTQALPNIDAPTDLQVLVTPERVSRGEYLANSVCVCMDRHSTRDWNMFAGPPVPGTLCKGGEVFDQTMQFPGRFISRNITPHGLGTWSDGEVYSAITSGVSKDGHPFFPVMPYPYYSALDNEDVYSIIAYLRSLSAIESDPEPSKADFPVSVILHTMPKPAAPVQRPDPGDKLAYGAYVTNAAGCRECHTKMVKGERVGELFAGGSEFNFPNGKLVRSPNITPSSTGGIGAWTRQQFIARFKSYTDSTYVPKKIDRAKGDLQTVMPWGMYAGMTEQDLGAIYDHLRTVKAVDGTIERWTSAADKVN